MPRPKQKKHICCQREGLLLRSSSDENKVLVLSLEAFETFRLIDYEHMTQLEASKVMGVGRTTIQKLYQEARKTIAKSLIEDTMVRIKGGEHLMQKKEVCCHQHTKTKKVAIVLNDARELEAYHQASQFILCSFEEGDLNRKDLIHPEGTEKKLCRRFMLSLGVDAVVTTSMSKHTYQKYQDCGIKVYHSTKTVEVTISNYLNESLESIQNYLVELDVECKHPPKDHKTGECCQQD